MSMIGLLVAASLQVSAPSVQATEEQDEGGRFYLGLGIGASYAVADELSGLPVAGQPDQSFSIDAGLGGAGAVFLGYRVTPQISVELEAASWVVDTRAYSGEYVGTNLLSLNAVFWGDQSARFIPYGGLGVGYSRFLDDDGVVGLYSGRVAAKAKAGIVMPVARSHGIGVEASFVTGPNFEEKEEFGDSVEQELSAFGLTANYRYQFGGFAGR